LINPSQEKVYGVKMSPIYPPLGLLYIGAVLKKAGHDVKLLDIDLENVTEQSFKEVLREFKPSVLGITSVTPTIKDAVKWAREAKIHNPSIRVVVGGIHATIAPLELAKEPSIDFVVVGEGERTVVELLKKMEGKAAEYEDVKGIVFKDKGKTIMNQARELIADMDEMPIPDRSLLRYPERYVPPDAVHTPVATIMTSRGCPGDCTFCCTKQIFTRHVRLRSVDNILSELDTLVNVFKVKEVHIADDTFTINKKRVLEFCDKVKKKNYGIHFEFMNGIRADCVDEEILGALRSIKVRNVGFGVESGSKEVLRLAKKNIDMEKVRRAFKLSKRFGFETWAFFIIGLPGENSATVRESIEFAKELDPDFAKFLILKPYPGSEVFQYLSERKLIDNYDYDLYGVYTDPVHHLPDMSKKDMLMWQKKAFTSFYLRPKKIIRHISRIRSFTQLRLAVRGTLFVFFNIFKKAKR
jgi:radical SAM superfamily enzyme YgiQ (UPF0313 family)